MSLGRTYSLAPRLRRVLAVLAALALLLSQLWWAGLCVPAYADDEPEPEPTVQVVSAQLLYKQDGMEDFAVLPENALHIATAGGSIAFDVELTYSDETTARASEAGVQIKWETTNTSISKIDDSGVLTALSTGNGTFYVKASFADEELAAIAIEPQDGVRVRISNNAKEVASAMTVYFTDQVVDSHSTLTAYPAASLPQIAYRNGGMTKVQLNARVRWSTGRITETQSQDGLARSYVLSYCTDENDNYTSTKLVTVSGDGTVEGTAAGSGFAYVACSVPALGYSTTVKIKVTGPRTYVDAIDFCDSSGTPFGAGIKLADGENIKQLNLRVIYYTYSSSAGMHKETIYSYEARWESWLASNGFTCSLKNYRSEGNLTDNLYSELSETGSFHALTGFVQAYVVATITNCNYDGTKNISQGINVYQEQKDDYIGGTSMMTVNIYHISDYEKYGDKAVPAKTGVITAAQLEALGNPYSDWYTFRRGSSDATSWSWGTMYCYGVSITSFLSLLNVDASDLHYIEFKGDDGVTPTEGWWSESRVLETQYRYSNYYMRKVSDSASYLGQSSVAPMIALKVYVDYGNDYNGNHWGDMTTNSTMRIVTGMSGPSANNARNSIYRLNEINIVISDQPVEPVEPGGGGGGGSGGGTGGGSDTGGGSGSNAGTATEGADGGSGTGSEGTNGNATNANSITLHELQDVDEHRIIEEATQNNPLRVAAFVVAGLALIAGAAYSNYRYQRQVRKPKKGSEHGEADAS